MASVAQSTQTDRMNQIFNGLKNRSLEVRLQSAEELRRFVCALPEHGLLWSNIVCLLGVADNCRNDL